MKQIAIIIGIILIPVVAFAATYRGTYTDSSGIYSSPTSSAVYKDGSVSSVGLAFSNASTATNGNRPGSVLVTLTNVTSIGDYTVTALDAGGTWHTLAVRHDPTDTTTLGNVYNNTTGIKNKTDNLPDYWPF